MENVEESESFSQRSFVLPSAFDSAVVMVRDNGLVDDLNV